MSTRSVFLIKQGDRLPAYEAVLVQTVDGVEEPVDLSDAEAAYFILKAKGGDTVWRKAMTIEEPREAGMVTYAWADGDTAVAGRFEVEIEVRFSGARSWTFPTQGILPLTILEDAET